MKILHLITGLEIGGAEVMLTSVLPRLTGHDHVVCSLSTKGALGEKIDKLGIPVYALGPGKRFSPASILAFRKIVRREKPDIISTRLIHADIFGRVFGRLFGVKTIVCSLESVLDDSRYDKYFWLERLTSFLVRRYTAVSQAVKNRYVYKAKIRPEKIEVVYNGIDLQKFSIDLAPSDAKRRLGYDENAILIGYVAKLRPERNHQTLLSAFARLKADLPSARLVLAGDGPEKENLKRLAAELKIADKVNFLGNRDDVPQILKALDVFVSLSAYEGMSIAILEAMASGLAIVASDIEPNRELIADGMDGLLINPFDPLSVTEKITKLLRDTALRQGFGDKMKKKSTAFSIDSTVNRLKSLYESCF